MKRWSWLSAALAGCALAGSTAPVSAAPAAPGARAATFPVTPYYRWIPGHRGCPLGPQHEVLPGIKAWLLPTKRVQIPAPGKSVTVNWTANIPGKCAGTSKSCGYNLQKGAPQPPRGVSVTTSCLLTSGRYDCVPIPKQNPAICRATFTITLTTQR